MVDVKFTFDTIVEEHRVLREMIKELRNFLKEPRPDIGSEEAHTWASQLTERIVKLHEKLALHFQEEDHSGALEELRRRHPASAKDIEVLRCEHGQILDDLRAILGAAMVYAEGKPPASQHLRKWTLSILDQLARHERTETDLISRSVATTEPEERMDYELDQYLLGGDEIELNVEAFRVPVHPRVVSPVKALQLGSSLNDALKVIQQGGASCVVILDETKLKGLITERDLVTRVLGRGLDLDETRVEDVMTREPFTLRADEPLTDAMNLMDIGGYRHVLIVDENGGLQGVVTARRLLNYIVELFPEELKVLPPSVKKEVPHERYGP